MPQLNQRKSPDDKALEHIQLFHIRSYCLGYSGICFAFALAGFFTSMGNGFTSRFLHSLATDPSLTLVAYLLIAGACLTICAVIVLLVAYSALILRLRAHPCLCGRMASGISFSKGPKLLLLVRLLSWLTIFECVVSWVVIILRGGNVGLALDSAMQLSSLWCAISGILFFLVSKSRYCSNLEEGIRLVTDSDLLKSQLEKMSETELLGLSKLAADFGEHTNASIIIDQLASGVDLQIAGKSKEELQLMLKVALQDKNAPKADLISSRLMMVTEDEVCN